MRLHQSFTEGLRRQQNRTSVASHHVMLSSKLISKSLLKCLHLETSSNLLFRRFVPWCEAISNSLFKERLRLSIARFIGVHLCTIFQAISPLLFVDLRFHTSFESSISFLYSSILNDFLSLVNRFWKVVSQLPL